MFRTFLDSTWWWTKRFETCKAQCKQTVPTALYYTMNSTIYWIHRYISEYKTASFITKEAQQALSILTITNSVWANVAISNARWKISVNLNLHKMFVDIIKCWIKIDQLDVTCFIISLFNAQHVSNVGVSILRSLRLICWVISCVVLLWFDVCYCYGVVRLRWSGILMQAEALLQPA